MCVCVCACDIHVRIYSHLLSTRTPRSKFCHTLLSFLNFLLSNVSHLRKRESERARVCRHRHTHTHTHTHLARMRSLSLSNADFLVSYRFLRAAHALNIHAHALPAPLQCAGRYSWSPLPHSPLETAPEYIYIYTYKYTHMYIYTYSIYIYIHTYIIHTHTLLFAQHMLWG